MSLTPPAYVSNLEAVIVWVACTPGLRFPVLAGSTSSGATEVVCCVPGLSHIFNTRCSVAYPNNRIFCTLTKVTVYAQPRWTSRWGEPATKKTNKTPTGIANIFGSCQLRCPPIRNLWAQAYPPSNYVVARVSRAKTSTRYPVSIF